MSISDSLGSRCSVDLAQGTICYRQRSEGPVLLFLHEYPAGGDTWRKVVPLLAGRFRCIAPDWPYGLHERAMNPQADLTPPGCAQIVADFLEALGLHHVTLVSSGGSGVVAEITAAEHPARIAALVRGTGDALHHYPPRALMPYKLLASLPPPATWLAAQTFRFLPLTRQLYRRACKAGIDERVLRHYVDTVARNTGARRDMCKAIRSIDSGHAVAAVERLSARELPVLVVWAPEDKLFPLSDGEKLAKTLPLARIETIDNCRTFAGEDQPARLAELIANFVNNEVSAHRL